MLVLDKQERGEGEMRGLVRDLLYAGGSVLVPPVARNKSRKGSGQGQGQGQGQAHSQEVLGGWEWDNARWVLVGLEL